MDTTGVDVGVYDVDRWETSVKALEVGVSSREPEWHQLWWTETGVRPAVHPHLQWVESHHTLNINTTDL